MSITVTDLFCGAGGSSLGAELAGGTLRLGLNHWERAVETHATNFQHADHDCEDVSSLTTSRIRRYPDSDVLLASPECVNHSLAKGARRRKTQAPSLFDDGPAGDDEQDRSRATMWDVCRFAEQKLLAGHPYRAIIVENVVDAFRWGWNDDGGLFAAWLSAMKALGYEHQTVWLNSMFCPPTPQSRDRMYVVFWRRGMRAPDLRVEPLAWCPKCEAVVHGRQTFKRTDRPMWGRYGAQYFYTCPECYGTVLPGVFPAASIIDRSLPASPIGERARPLAKNTRERIRRGLELLRREPFAIRLLHGTAPRPLTLPLVTATARQDLAMVMPVAGNTHESTPGNRARLAGRVPLSTVHGTLDRAVVTPYSTGGEPKEAVIAPVDTLTRQNKTALVMANTQNGVPRDAGREASQTLRTEGGLSLVTRTAHRGANGSYSRNGSTDPAYTVTQAQDLALVYANRNNGVARPAGEHPSQTVCGAGGHLAVLVANYGPGPGGWTQRAGVLPFGSVTANDSHSLVVPYYRDGKPAPAGREPTATVSTRDRLALVVPPLFGGELLDSPHEEESRPITDEEIDSCSFRMFSLPEIAGAMAMAEHIDGQEYVVVGNKRERMAQYGNAVTPPAMQLLFSRLLPILDEAS